MATLIYTTGNGYNCGCCRMTSTDSFSFDTEEDAIGEAIEVASYAEWDFSIKDIIGYDGDENDLENRIMSAVVSAEKDKDRKLKIAQLKKDIAYTEDWFATLEQQKQTKQDLLDKNRAMVIELEGKL